MLPSDVRCIALRVDVYQLIERMQWIHQPGTKFLNLLDNISRTVTCDMSVVYL